MENHYCKKCKDWGFIEIPNDMCGGVGQIIPCPYCESVSVIEEEEEINYESLIPKTHSPELENHLKGR